MILMETSTDTDRIYKYLEVIISLLEPDSSSIPFVFSSNWNVYECYYFPSNIVWDSNFVSLLSQFKHEIILAYLMSTLYFCML